MSVPWGKRLVYVDMHFKEQSHVPMTLSQRRV